MTGNVTRHHGQRPRRAGQAMRALCGGFVVITSWGCGVAAARVGDSVEAISAWQARPKASFIAYGKDTDAPLAGSAVSRGGRCRRPRTAPRFQLLLDAHQLVVLCHTLGSGRALLS